MTDFTRPGASITRERETMRHTSFVLLCILVTALALGSAGCGDDAGSNNGDGDGNNGTQTGSAGLRPVLGAMCDYIERCPSGDFALAYGSRSECVDILDFVMTCRVVEIGEIDSGEYDVEKVSVPISQQQQTECIQWLQNVECDESLSNESSPCDFVGSAFSDDDASFDGARRGEICERENCIDGLECVDSAQSTADETYCRICVAPGGPGTPCRSPSRPCQEGLNCNSELGVCDYPLAEGEDCESSPRPCEEELFCEPGTFDCRPLLAAGESCVYDDQAYNYYCASEFCNENSGECDDGGHEGDSCTDDTDCRSNEQLSCESGECVAPLPNGAACSEDQECRNRDCDDATGKCGLPDGSDCFNGDECQSGFCDRVGTDRTCQPVKELGESCDLDDECGENVCHYITFRNEVCMAPCDEEGNCPAEHRCEAGACVPLQDDGGSCEGDEDCLSGWCSSAETCGVKPGIGDACDSSQDCYPQGYCEGGVCVAKKGPGQACTGYESCLEPYICLEGSCKQISLSCNPAPIGQMCTWLRVCQEGAYCDRLDNFTCKEKKSAGASCNRSNECKDGLVCGNTETGRACVETAGEGDDCTLVECGAELYCNRSMSPATCVPLSEPGDPCEDEEQCAGDAYCDGMVCVSNEPELMCVLP